MAWISGLSRDPFAAESLWLQIDSLGPYIEKETGSGAACVRRMGWKEWGESSQTLPTSAGMFMELVAKPIPYVMEDSTARKLATSWSSSSWMLRFPGVITQRAHGALCFLCFVSQAQRWTMIAQNANIWTNSADGPHRYGTCEWISTDFWVGPCSSPFTVWYICTRESARLNIRGADRHSSMTDGGGAELIRRIDGIVIFHLTRRFHFLQEKNEIMINLSYASRSLTCMKN